MLIEEKPGIPPSAKHILSLVKKMKDSQSSCILMSSFYTDKWTKKIKQNTLSHIEVVAIEVGALPQVTDYFLLIGEALFKLLKTAEPLLENKRGSDESDFSFRPGLFNMSSMLTGIHCYLGLHVLARKIIFVDLGFGSSRSFWFGFGFTCRLGAWIFKKLFKRFIQLSYSLSSFYTYSCKKEVHLSGGFYRHCLCLFFRSCDLAV